MIRWSPPVLVALLAAVTHGRGCWNGFIWDDDFYVTQNLPLRTLDGLRQIWLEPLSIPQYYPLVHTTYWIEYQLWGLNPAGYHFVNVVLHMASAALLWRLFRQLEVPAAGLAAALFAVHPLGVESVAWITERKNTLSLFFAILSSLAWLRWRFPLAADARSSSGRTSGASLALSIFCFTLGMLSKTVVAMLVPTLLIITWTKTGRITRNDLFNIVPFICIGLPLAAATVWLEKMHVFRDDPGLGLEPLQRLLIAGRAPWFYAAKLVWPHPLAFFYTRWTVDPLQIWQWAFPVLLVASLVAAWWQRRRIGRAPLAVMVAAVAALFPALGFIDVYPFRYSFVADHFAYHALPAGVIAAAAGITAAMTMLKPLPIGPAVVLCLAGVSVARTAVFADLETLYTDTLAKNPTCSCAANNLGFLYLATDRVDRAIAMLSRAAAEAPFRDEQARALANLGRAFLKLEKNEQALAVVAKARTIHDTPQVRGVLAIALVRTGRLEEARRLFAELPAEEAAANGILLAQGEAALLQDDYRQADEWFKASLDTLTAGAREEARNEIIVAYLSRGRFEEARAWLRQQTGTSAAARGWMNVGVAFARAGRFEDAIKSLESAAGLAPQNHQIQELLARSRAAARHAVSAGDEGGKPPETPSAPQ